MNNVSQRTYIINLTGF